MEYRWFARYQSQRSIGARGRPAVVSQGRRREAYCKRSMKWRNIILAVLQCTTNTTDRKSKSGRTFESFILRGRLSTVIISSWYRIERATFNDRTFESFIFRESLDGNPFENFTLRERFSPSMVNFSSTI